MLLSRFTDFKTFAEYTHEEKKKSEFVSSELVYTCRLATGGLVEDMTYLKARGSDDEYVRVRMPATTFDVNVSCDSMLAIAKDVIAALIRLGY